MKYSIIILLFISYTSSANSGEPNNPIENGGNENSTPSIEISVKAKVLLDEFKNVKRVRNILSPSSKKLLNKKYTIA